MMKKVVLLLIAIFVYSISYTQQRVVTGRVLLSDDFGIGNILITAKKSKATVLSNPDGTFTIFCEDNDVLKFKSKSFFPKTKSVSGIDTLTVYLVFKEGQKNVDLAHEEGYLSNEGIKFISQNLSNASNDFSSYSDVFELIRGKFNGVEVAGNIVRIRGSHSLSGSNAATYLVNGTFVNDISDILPITIESIKVLKSTEAAIYGSQGLYGVVVINTKK
ncbi:MAG: TonB-dependent receptor plug domain-containing protein [Bacteroidetes bacterium]|nr:TonB-dependent receptor plug domain-containing protein [Bacteroidota bacterium]